MPRPGERNVILSHVNITAVCETSGVAPVRHRQRKVFNKHEGTGRHRTGCYVFFTVWGGVMCSCHQLLITGQHYILSNFRLQGDGGGSSEGSSQGEADTERRATPVSHVYGDDVPSCSGPVRRSTMSAARNSTCTVMKCFLRRGRQRLRKVQHPPRVGPLVWVCLCCVMVSLGFDCRHLFKHACRKVTVEKQHVDKKGHLMVP